MMAGDLIKVICLTILIIIIGVAFSWFVSVPAHGTQVCLTKKEARALWPKRHLYWYGNDHCWSNRRGGPPRNLRYDLIRENHAQALPAPPVQDPGVKVAGSGDRAEPPPPSTGTVAIQPWPLAAKPIQIIEVIWPAKPVPVKKVEASNLPPLPPPKPAKVSISLGTSIGAALAGTLSAILLAAFFIPFSERTIDYVKRGANRVRQRVAATRKQISAAGYFTRTEQPPIPPIDIRDFIRRAERAGHVDHLKKVYTSLADDRTAYPTDDSAIACWSRSIRSQT